MADNPSIAGLNYAVNCVRLAFGHERASIKPDARFEGFAGWLRYRSYRAISFWRPLAQTLVRCICAEIQKSNISRDWRSLTVREAGEILGSGRDGNVGATDVVLIGGASRRSGCEWERVLHTLACREELSFEDLLACYWPELADQAEVIRMHLENGAHSVGIPYGFWRPQDVIDEDDFEVFEDWSGCVVYDLKRSQSRPIPQPRGMAIIPTSVVQADPLLRDAQGEYQHTVHSYVYYAAYLYRTEQ